MSEEQQPQSKQDAGQDRQGRSAGEPSTIVPVKPAAVPATEAPARLPFDPLRYAGVSFEEVRKGQPPAVIKNPDQAVWNDRFTSQFTLVNMTDGRWKPVRPIFIPE